MNKQVQLLSNRLLEFNQCNYYYELQQDAVFSDSVQTPLTLFIDLQNIAWGRNGVEPIESGCFQGVSGSDGVVRSVCLSVPHMIPMSVSEQPTIERFHIYKADSTVDTAGGVLVFYMDDNSQVLGGFSRRLYNQTSELPDIPWFDMSIKRMTYLTMDLMNLKHMIITLTLSTYTFHHFHWIPIASILFG